MTIQVHALYNLKAGQALVFRDQPAFELSHLQPSDRPRVDSFGSITVNGKTAQPLEGLTSTDDVVKGKIEFDNEAGATLTVDGRGPTWGVLFNVDAWVVNDGDISVTSRRDDATGLEFTGAGRVTLNGGSHLDVVAAGDATGIRITHDHDVNLLGAVSVHGGDTAVGVDILPGDRGDFLNEGTLDVVGAAGAIGVRLSGQPNSVDTEGAITVTSDGAPTVGFDLTAALGSVIVGVGATGSISADTAVSCRGGAAADLDLRFLNYGHVTGSVLCEDAADVVVNVGVIRGDVMLGGGDDTYTGSLQGKVSGAVNGEDGADRLTGAGSADRLFGGAGADTITGGGGHDQLSGGAGADLFVFNAASDSAAGSARDQIADFAPGEDRIDLHALEPEAGTPLAWIGRAKFDAGHGQGEVRYHLHVAHTDVQIDLDGDGHVDTSIRLQGILTLSAADFVL